VVEEPVGDVPDFWNPQVLFNDEQYPTLPYTRYEATTLLDWGPRDPWPLRRTCGCALLAVHRPEDSTVPCRLGRWSLKSKEFWKPTGP
jgi:hypothetical protein